MAKKKDKKTTKEGEFSTTIGLEIHVQLKTKTKMFCRCLNDSEGSQPNENVCPICAGMPGTLPATNKKAVEWTALTGLALNCQVNKESKFDRKHYFYPDLPKGFQISQYDKPIARDGHLEIGKNGKKSIGINRVHLEEDAGKLIHPKGGEESLLDLNRAGTPLMEIVSEPDLSSPEDAKEFLRLLQLTVRYLKVSDADMEKGHLRCDANISVQKGNRTTMIVEVKNMNSFRGVSDALSYEEERLKRDFNKYSKKKRKETRGWLADKKETTAQRDKEEAADYRYFPEPDIPPLKFSKEEVKKLKASLPELPDEIRKRFAKLGLSDDQFWALAYDKKRMNYLVGVIELLEKKDYEEAANWIINEDVPLDISLEHFKEFIKLRTADKLPGPLAKKVLAKMSELSRGPEDVMEEEGLEAQSGEELTKIVNEVVKDNKSVVEDYEAGKESAIQYLVGQVMKETKGQANPQEVNKILKERLQSSTEE